MLRHSDEKPAFLTSNRSYSQHLWDIRLPPSLLFIQSRSPSIDELPFKAVLPSFEHGLLWLATLIYKGIRGDHKFVNAASHFGPLGYFLESVDVREASLPLPTHHITSHHIICFCCNIPKFNVMMEISWQWHDGKEKCVQVEILHDKPVAVPFLMEKFLVDYYFACCANVRRGARE